MQADSAGLLISCIDVDISVPQQPQKYNPSAQSCRGDHKHILQSSYTVDIILTASPYIIQTTAKLLIKKLIIKL